MKKSTKRLSKQAARGLIAAGLFAVCWLLISAGEALIVSQQDKNPEEVQPVEVSSFLRKDLLPRLDPGLASVKRNPFRPVSSGSSGASASRRRAQRSQEEVKTVSILESLYITCLGLVKSENKTVALIQVDGQALSLGEGEELVPGIRLVRITSEEILFRDDQGNFRKVRVKEI